MAGHAGHPTGDEHFYSSWRSLASIAAVRLARRRSVRFRRGVVAGYG